MREIGLEIREYVDAVAPPIDLDSVVGARPIELRRTRHPLVVAAVLAVAAVVVLAVAVIAHHDTRDTVAAGGPTEAPAWYPAAGELKTAPPVPAGWTVVDVLDFRFAIPPHWVVGNTECASMPPGTVGFVDVVDKAVSCDPPVSLLPPSSVTISRGDPVEGGTPTTLGVFAATLVIRTCPEGARCGPFYGLPNGYTIAASGPDVGGVLATFTDSGARQALQSGPLVDASRWRLKSYDGVEFRVPAEWRPENLPASINSSENGFGGQVDPGACGGAMFQPDERPTVFVGHGLSAGQISCPVSGHYDTSVSDGVWIRAVAPGVEAAQVESLPVIARKTVNGLDIAVLRPGDGVESAPHPPLELLIRRGTTVVRVTLGVGLDPAIARTILRSLRATS